MKTSAKRFGLAGTVLAATMTLVACGPGSSAPTTATSAAPASSIVPSTQKITLNVWDQNVDGGMNDAMKKLNAAFMQAHPNITVQRTAKSFSDLKTTLRLALSGNNPPDVVQANQGYPDMGTFVKDGMLTNLNNYATLYKWNSYYPSGLLNLNKFTGDGKTWQSGNLYGVSQTGEYVGVYYNKSILSKLGIAAPTTLTQLTAAFAKAKAKGVMPLEYGDLQKDQGIHVFGVVQAAIAGSSAVSNLVTAKSGAWTDPANVKAAETLQNWAKSGYFTSGANGLDQQQAVAQFAKGKAAFFIDGTWDMATISQGLGATNVGITTLVPPGSATPVTQGGEGLAFAITSKSKNAAAAAAYIDFITNAKAMNTLIATGNLPVVLPAGYKPNQSTLSGMVSIQYGKLNSSGTGIVPYLDYTTPTFFDTLTAAVQDLTAGRTTPQKFTATLQTDYAKFKKSR